jgi:hypothetical protein
LLHTKPTVCIGLLVLAPAYFWSAEPFFNYSIG